MLNRHKKEDRLKPARDLFFASLALTVLSCVLLTAFTIWIGIHWAFVFLIAMGVLITGIAVSILGYRAAQRATQDKKDK
jgi:hypothetical protein